MFSQSFSSTFSDEDISGGDPNDPKDQWREADVLQQNQQPQFQQHQQAQAASSGLLPGLHQQNGAY